MSNLVYTASTVLTINSQESFSLRLVAKTFRPNLKLTSPLTSSPASPSIAELTC